MNEYDRGNLNFLLGCDPETLLDWYNNVSEDDHKYASELMAQYSTELAMKQRFYAVEEVNLDNLIPDAQEYLKRFSIKK
jgi:beta-xylosidase